MCRFCYLLYYSATQSTVARMLIYDVFALKQQPKWINLEEL